MPQEQEGNNTFESGVGERRLVIGHFNLSLFLLWALQLVVFQPTSLLQLGVFVLWFLGILTWVTSYLG